MTCGVNIEIHPGIRFCSACGARLQVMNETHELDQMTKEDRPMNFEGERKEATITFSDLSAYTSLTERLDPELVESLMNSIKEIAIRCVESEGGIVNQFIGDEIVALFGIPMTRGDDPKRAILAMMKLHEAVVNFSRTIEGLYNTKLNMHSSINTGLIITSHVDKRDGSYGLTGDTVNTGSRLLSLAKGGQILIGPRTAKLVAANFELIELPPIIFKGKSQTLIPFRVVGISQGFNSHKEDKAKSKHEKQNNHVSLPSSVQNAFQTLFDRLDSDSQTVLRLAAVIGHEFSIELIQTILEGKIDLQGILNNLEEQRLLVRTNENLFTFRHSQIQKVIYETLLFRQRKKIHGIVANTIASLYKDCIEDHLDAVLQHFIQSDHREDALPYLELAGDCAVRSCCFDTADRQYKSALEIIKLESRAEKEKYLAIALKWAAISYRSPSDEKINLMKVALNITRDISNRESEIMCLTWMGSMYFFLAHNYSAEEYFEKSMEVAEKCSQADLHLLASDLLGRCYITSAKHELAIQVLEKSITQFDQRGMKFEASLSRAYLIANLGYLGRFEEALSNLSARTKGEPSFDQPSVTLFEKILTTFFYLRKGEWNGALDYASEVRILGQKLEIFNGVLCGLAAEGLARFELGEKSQGMSSMQEAFNLAITHNLQFMHSFFVGIYADMKASVGSYLAANQLANVGLKNASVYGNILVEGECYRALAVIEALDSKQWENSASYFSKSLESASIRKALPEKAVTLLRRAEVFLPSEQYQMLVRSSLKEARDLFKTLGMSYWLKRAEKI